MIGVIPREIVTPSVEPRRGRLRSSMPIPLILVLSANDAVQRIRSEMSSGRIREGQRDIREWYGISPGDIDRQGGEC